MGATESRGHILAELREMIRDPADFYRTRPTVDRVDLAHAIVQMLEDDADDLERLQTFAIGVRSLLGSLAFPDGRLDEIVVEAHQRPSLPVCQEWVVGDD